MRTISRAIPSGGSTKSTQPEAMALCGIPSCWAVASWAKVMPPSALIASSPRVPSVAVPDRTTPMAWWRWLFRQRTEELIDRTVYAVALARQELQRPADDDHALSGRDYVDVVRLDRRLVLNLHDRHCRRPRQDFRQGAGVRRGEVLHQDERHAGIGRQRLEQLRECLQSAGRGADADDRERCVVARLVAVVRGFVRRRRSRKLIRGVVDHARFSSSSN